MSSFHSFHDIPRFQRWTRCLLKLPLLKTIDLAVFLKVIFQTSLCRRQTARARTPFLPLLQSVSVSKIYGSAAS